MYTLCWGSCLLVELWAHLQGLCHSVLTALRYSCCENIRGATRSSRSWSTSGRQSISDHGTKLQWPPKKSQGAGAEVWVLGGWRCQPLEILWTAPCWGLGGKL